MGTKDVRSWNRTGSLGHVDGIWRGEQRRNVSMSLTENSARSVKGGGKWRCMRR